MPEVLGSGMFDLTNNNKLDLPFQVNDELSPLINLSEGVQFVSVLYVIRLWCEIVLNVFHKKHNNL